jgi:hypothetical protein
MVKRRTQSAGKRSRSLEEYRDANLRRLAEFHSTESDLLLTRFRHIEKLLGLSHHSVSEGDYCEDLLRSFLRQSLPERYAVNKGFIKGRPLGPDTCQRAPKLGHLEAPSK